MTPPGSYDHCAFRFDAQRTVVPGGGMPPPYVVVYRGFCV